MVNLNTSLAKILSSKSKYLLRHSSILRQHISYKSSYQPPSSHPFDGSSGPANRDLKSKNASPISKFHYTSNNEIEAYIANQTYGLEPRHLATIRARPVRSPYTNRQQILLWNEDLVKIKALEVYKNEQGILKAAARKKQIRKKQFEEITKYIESSNKQRKIIEENYKIRDAQLKDKSQRTTKLLNIIKKSGGLSYADLILDEVIQIYEDTSAKKSQKMKNSENKEFVIFDHKQNVVHRGSFEMGKLGVSAVASEKDVAEESQSSNDSEISATEDEQVLLPNLKSHGFASISRIERTGTNYSLRAQKVTLIAAITNAIITCWKLAVAIITNSATMYGEVYHSLGDTLMQLMLFMSHRYADKYKPSEKYPYGFKQLPQIASLASGIMIFSMGAVNSIAAGYHILAAPGNATASSVEALGATTQAITYPTAASSLTEIICNPFVVLGVSFVLESISLLTAYKEVRRNAREKNLTFYQQLKSGTDPTTSVVFLEDMAAVTGLMVAAGCLGLMEYSGSIIFDGVGSIGVGSILAYISYKLTSQSALALMGKSVPKTQLESMREQLENDSSVRAVFDMKCTYVTPSLYRLKAEVEFDGRTVCDHYLKKQEETLQRDIEKIREEMRLASESSEAAREFLLKHSSDTIDQLGKDIDRIETGLKQSNKDLRHIDLELN